MIDLAVSKLSGWQGVGPSWYADSFERGSEADPQQPVGTDSLSIAWRGRVRYRAHKECGIRQFRGWGRAAKIVSMPYSAMAVDAAIALADMKLGKAAQNLLVLYACEDFSRWPDVRRFLLTRWDGRPCLLEHAMASLLRPAKRTREDAGELARFARMRKADYLRERRRSEAMILGLLEEAGTAFVLAYYGNPGFPQNSFISRNTNWLPRAA